MATYTEFRNQPHTHARGRSAEAAATAWLEEHGYQIQSRNHETPAGEIHLVFSGGGTIRLSVECLEAQLSDLGPAWSADHAPRHSVG